MPDTVLAALSEEYINTLKPALQIELRKRLQNIRKSNA